MKEGGAMPGARKARVRRQHATAPRTPETRTERALRRSRTARALAADAAREAAAAPARKVRRVSLYERIVRSGSVSAAGFAALTALVGHSMPAEPVIAAVHVAETPVVVAVVAEASTSGLFAPVPRGPIATLAGAPLADGLPVLPLAAKAPLVLDRIARPLIEILPVGVHAAPAPVHATAVRYGLRPMHRPERAEPAVEAPAVTAADCTFGTIVQRGSVVFHRPPSCL